MTSEQQNPLEDADVDNDKMPLTPDEDSVNITESDDDDDMDGVQPVEDETDEEDE